MTSCALTNVYVRALNTSQLSASSTSKARLMCAGCVQRKHRRPTGYILPGHTPRRQATLLGTNKQARRSLQHHSRFRCDATSVPVEEEPLDSSPGARSLSEYAYAFYKFTRPHTMIGTLVSILSVSLLAVQSASEVTPHFFYGLTQAWIPALLMNIHIVGLNQLSDIEIDKVNKPYLPLASGEFSPRTGTIIVTLTAIAAFALGALTGSAPLLWTLGVSFALGIVYSVEIPGLRWKNNCFLAAACIFLVRAVIVQAGFFLHMRSVVLGGEAAFTGPIALATCFMTLASVVIALFKDIPDKEGDEQADVRTLTVRLGPARVFQLCRGLMLLAYAAALLGPALMLPPPAWPWMRALAGAAHLALAALFWHRSTQVDLSDKDSIYEFYMFIWKLFYAEYLVLPLMR